MISMGYGLFMNNIISMKAKVLVQSMLLTTVLLCCSCCSKDNMIAQIDREETYPEAPGTLAIVYNSLDEIEKDADKIIYGNIENTEIEYLDGLPQTHTFVRIKESVKGGLPEGKIVEIIEEGGYEGVVMGGIPQMAINSEFCLFLTEDRGNYYICGAFQGRFIIRSGYVFQQATEDVKLKGYRPVEKNVFLNMLKLSE